MPSADETCASCGCGAPLDRDDVADGGDARHVRPIQVVDDHVAAIQGEADVLGAEPVGHRPAPGRHRAGSRPGTTAALPPDSSRLDLHGVAVHARRGDPGARMRRDALLPERLLQLRRDRLVLDGHQARQQLEDGDLRAEAVEDRAELHADRAAAENHHRLRHFLQVNGLVARDDPASVDLDPWHAARLRAGGDDDLLRLELLLLLAGHGDLAVAEQARRALDPRDPVLLEQVLDPLRQRR